MKQKGRHRVLWGFIYVITFIVVFVASALIKMAHDPFNGKYSVVWNDEIGTVYNDLSYGEGEANKFDLYVPADNTNENYGLVVYLHAGGFTSGDKKDDVKMLQWLCSKGYVAAGINYTLFSEQNPTANVYTQSVEIRDAVPYVIAEAEKLGYHIDEMAISGGSAGHALAMLYAYRDADTSPVPVKMVFGAVGPSSFYPEDWACFGFDQDTEEARTGAAVMFSVMSGKEIKPEMFGTPEYDEAIKDISALLWVNENTVPSVMAYGKYDKMQSFEASIRLAEALEANGVPYEYIVCEHSGHGLQNDNKQYGLYMEKVCEYLDTYLPVK